MIFEEVLSVKSDTEIGDEILDKEDSKLTRVVSKATPQKLKQQSLQQLSFKEKMEFISASNNHISPEKKIIVETSQKKTFNRKKVRKIQSSLNLMNFERPNFIRNQLSNRKNTKKIKNEFLQTRETIKIQNDVESIRSELKYQKDYKKLYMQEKAKNQIL